MFEYSGCKFWSLPNKQPQVALIIQCLHLVCIMHTDTGASSRARDHTRSEAWRDGRTIVPADVRRYLFIWAVDEQDRVVAGHITPSDG